MNQDSLPSVLRNDPPPWMLNHPELAKNAMALADGSIAELIHLSLQIATKPQPKPYAGTIPK